MIFNSVLSENKQKYATFWFRVHNMVDIGSYTTTLPEYILQLSVTVCSVCQLGRVH